MHVRRGFILAAAGIALCAVPLPARGETALSAGVAIESSGYGVSLGYALPGNVVIRAQSGSLTFDRDFHSQGNTFTGRGTVSNVLLVGELHPQGKPLYYAAGTFFNSNAFHGNTTSAGVILGSTNYGAGTAQAKVTWPSVAPYIGIGWAPIRGGLGFDLGAAFHGSPRVVVTTDIAGVSAADITSSQDQIHDDVQRDAPVYPVVGLRYTWAF